MSPLVFWGVSYVYIHIGQITHCNALDSNLERQHLMVCQGGPHSTNTQQAMPDEPTALFSKTINEGALL